MYPATALTVTEDLGEHGFPSRARIESPPTPGPGPDSPRHRGHPRRLRAGAPAQRRRPRQPVPQGHGALPHRRRPRGLGLDRVEPTRLSGRTVSPCAVLSSSPFARHDHAVHVETAPGIAATVGTIRSRPLQTTQGEIATASVEDVVLSEVPPQLHTVLIGNRSSPMRIRSWATLRSPFPMHRFGDEACPGTPGGGQTASRSHACSYPDRRDGSRTVCWHRVGLRHLRVRPSSSASALPRGTFDGTRGSDHGICPRPRFSRACG